MLKVTIFFLLILLGTLGGYAQTADEIWENTGILTSVRSVSASPDGGYAAVIISRADEVKIEVWDLILREKTFELESSAFVGIIRENMTFTPDGQYLIAERFVSTGTVLDTWDYLTGVRVRSDTVVEPSSPPPHYMLDLTVASTGEYLYAVGNANSAHIGIIDPLSGEHTTIMPATVQRYGLIRFSRDGSLVAIGRIDDTTTILYSFEQKSIVQSLSPGHSPISVVFTHDNKSVALQRETGGFEIWDVATGVIIAELSTPDAEFRVAQFSSDDRFLYTTRFGAHDIEVYNIATRTQERTLPAHTSYNTASILNDSLLISANELGQLEIWNSRSGENVGALDQPPNHHIAEVNDVAIDARQRYVVSAGSEAIAVWDFESGAFVRFIRSGRTFSVAISPDGALLASAGWGPVTVVELATGARVRTFDDFSALDVAFAPDGRSLAISGTQGEVTIRDTESWAVTASFVEGNSWMQNVAFSPDGRFVAAGSKDAVLRVWSLSDNELVTAIPNTTESPNGVKAMAFSPDGGSIATSARESITEWELASGSVKRVYEAPTNIPLGTINKLDYSSDGIYLVSAGLDEEVKMWNTQNGLLEYRISAAPAGEGFTANSFAVSPDGQFFARVNEEAGVRLWRWENAILDINEIDGDASIYRAYPNPFVNRCALPYSIAKTGNVRISLYDASGKLIGILLDALRTPGEYEIEFDGRDLASGAYYARIESAGRSSVTRLLRVE